MVDGTEPRVESQDGRSRRGRARLLVAGLALVALVVVGTGLAVTRPWEPVSSCPPVAEHPDWSVARRWDEALLDAIRRSLPNPPVHARNLFHTSVAMWDAWAAYDATATGYIVNEKASAGNVEAARNEAISYAAYRVLSARFIKAVGGDVSLSQFADLMDALCYPVTVTTTEGDSPAAIGNRIAAAVLAYGMEDGSNQANGYAAPDYQPVNEPLVVAEPGITMEDPNRWQPLQLAFMVSQNGIPIENGVQQAVGPHWGHVKGFGIPDGGVAGIPMDPGPPPRLGGDPASERAYKDQAVEVILRSSQLDAASTETIDISPGAIGNNTLGTNDGRGRTVNPATGQPYEPNVVKLGDYARALTEFWADGPKSETPPGHWNVIANEVSDKLAPDLRIGGDGPALDRLQWDVKLYLALNGAVHDAAIVAWGLKGHYDSVRPISMIRYLASRGQSSDPALPSYDPEGIPLVDGLVELITPQTTAAGQRHAALAGHEGEIAIRAWAGNPADPKTETSGVEWILGVAWVPYQLPTFVTPAFQGFTSGHSTFSRAAAEVMVAFTGSEFFPGGLAEWTKAKGSLTVEVGPSEDVHLQAATYYDAADQAGTSRLFGGIHIVADDFGGRTLGAECGKAAWVIAQRYYAGAAGS
ncbi:MAG: vanadium-dependent haloperoxidase [Chloroflexota bacterium]